MEFPLVAADARRRMSVYTYIAWVLVYLYVLCVNQPLPIA